MSSKVSYLLIVVAFLYVGCKDSTPKESNESYKSVPDTISVKTLKLSRQDFTLYGEYYGNVKAYREVALIAYSGGTVAQINASEGDYVKKGQSLANINGEKANAIYETAVLNENLARRTYEQMKEHLKSGNASQLAVDKSELVFLNAKTARIDAEKVRRGALCIAPFNGFVLSRFIELDDEVPPGSRTFIIGQLHKMKVDVNVSESDISEIKEGTQAEITFTALNGTTFNGQVIRVAGGSSPATHAYKTQIEINNKNKLIKPGMTATVKLSLRVMHNQFVVPSESILTEGDNNYLMIVSSGLAHRIYVKVEASDSVKSVVVGDLKVGDLLIVGNTHLVSENAPVRIEK